MNHSAAALHRLTVALFALLALVVATAVILARTSVDPVADWVNRLDADRVADGVGASWFTAVLVVLIVVTLYWGWRLIRTTVAPQRPDVLVLNGTGPTGTMTVQLQQIARAVQAQLSAQTVLSRVRAEALDDRGSKIVRVIVEARPERSYDEIAEVVAPAVRDLRAAFDGSDVHVQVFVHLVAPE